MAFSVSVPATCLASVKIAEWAEKEEKMKGRRE